MGSIILDNYLSSFHFFEICSLFCLCFVLYGGTVGYSYKISKDCSISIKITKSLNEEFDNHVIAVLKRKSELEMRYGLSCDEKELSQDIVFKLD